MKDAEEEDEYEEEAKEEEEAEAEEKRGEGMRTTLHHHRGKIDYRSARRPCTCPWTRVRRRIRARPAPAPSICGKTFPTT